jgi:hypothetical protein
MHATQTACGVQDSTRVPMRTQWESPPAIVAAADLLRVLLSPPSSPSGDATPDDASGGPLLLHMPPATAAVALGLVAVAAAPGGVLLRDVCLSPYCVLQLHQYHR